VSATASRLHRSGRIAIIERGHDIAADVTDGLCDAGFLVETVKCGESDLGRLSRLNSDLLIVEWPLPNLSCRELLEDLRRQPATARLPVIAVVTPISDEAEIVRALEWGADAVVSKPFSVKEFVARVGALLRRHALVHPADVVIVGDIELDRDGMRVRRRGKIVELGPIDYRLLELFLRNPGRVLGREEIICTVWGEESPVDNRTIDVHVGRLRKALLAASRRNPIVTVRGVGYRLDTH
jgi:two-component system, OmpR family, phosphate regulon response regulator PhoB